LQENVMRSSVSRLGILALFASAACGQTASGSAVDRTFQLVGGESPQAIQEIVNAVRMVTEMQQVVQGAAHASIAVQGTADQVAMAAWVIGELDQPTKAANLSYVPAGGGDSVARILYLTHTTTPRGTQEIVNIVRSVSEIQRILAYNSSAALVMRGSQFQIALSEWMVKQLDVAASPRPASAQYPAADPNGWVTNIFYLNHAQTPQQTQEIVNTVRSVCDIQRVTANNAATAITTRATPAQAAAAAWVVSELDRPAPQAAATDSYQMQGTADSAVRVFYVPGIQTSQDLQEIVNQIRAKSAVLRITAYQAANAVALRGTAGQAALAEQVIQQRAKL
jgi:hypothetical protein